MSSFITQPRSDISWLIELNFLLPITLDIYIRAHQTEMKHLIILIFVDCRRVLGLCDTQVGEVQVGN